jgi:hypothetical protein
MNYWLSVTPEACKELSPGYALFAYPGLIERSGSHTLKG